MRRREFITLLGGTAAAWPIAARAQEIKQVRRIGVLAGDAEHDPDVKARLAAFQQGLNHLGWSLDHNVRIEYRFAANNADQYQSLAKELVRLQPDLLLAYSVAEHMPSSHRRYANWTIERIRADARLIGPATAALCELILEQRPHPEQGFRACLGIVRLAGPHGAERLEAAAVCNDLPGVSVDTAKAAAPLVSVTRSKLGRSLARADTVGRARRAVGSCARLGLGGFMAEKVSQPSPVRLYTRARVSGDASEAQGAEAGDGGSDGE